MGKNKTVLQGHIRQMENIERNWGKNIGGQREACQHTKEQKEIGEKHMTDVEHGYHWRTDVEHGDNWRTNVAHGEQL